MKRLLFLLSFLPPFFLSAQNEERTVNFEPALLEEAGGVRLTGDIPPVQPTVGWEGRAYYSGFWEFGDGNFKSAVNTPDEIHSYSRAGEYDIILQITYHYDDGKQPVRKKVRVRTLTGNGRAGLTSTAFGNSPAAIALKASRQARAEEEIAFALSYRNSSPYFTNGHLHLFFNETRFPSTHFNFEESRLHFGETLLESAISAIDPMSEENEMRRVFSEPPRSAGNAAFAYEPPPPDSAPLFLENARRLYRDEKKWQFSNLEAGEMRNLFFTLQGLPTMIRDTSATIYLTAIFDPDDPAMAASQFILPLEIVSSHDPNSISVSDNRLNFRQLLRAGNLAYKVNFQNLGDGPARRIRINVETPAALNIDTLTLLDWYPVCPVCPDDNYSRGCLDTAITSNGLEFIFRNVYLPGLHENENPEPDSTKGFVQYRLKLKKNIPKLDITSKARIYFDNNAPITTNTARSHFKAGKSPGLKAGYEFVPGHSYDNYPFAGVTISPFRSWKFYPQAELLVGWRGKTELPEMVERTIHEKVGADPDIKDTTIIVDTTTRTRKFIALELPVLLRYNPSSFFGAGLGASARMFFEKGDFIQIRNTTDIIHEPGGIRYTVPNETEVTSGNFNDHRFDVRLFADLTFGSVRSGPNLGVRAGITLTEGARFFIQTSFEWKF